MKSKSKQKWLFITIVLLIFIGVVFFAIQLIIPHWRSDPTLVRPWAEAEWEQLFEPQSIDSLLRVDPSTVILEYNNGSIEFLGYARNSKKGNWPVQDVYRIKLDEVAQLPDGTISCKYIGIGFPDESFKDENEKRPFLKFYSPDLIPVTPTDIKPNMYHDGKSFLRSFSPVLHFVGESSKIVNYNYLTCRVFDARTHVKLNNSTAGWNPNFHIVQSISNWHSTPLVMAIDFTHGPIDEFVIDLTKRESVELLDGDAICYLGTFYGEGKQYSWNAKSPVSINEGGYLLEKKEIPHYVFSLTNMAGWSRYNLFAVLDDGQEVKMNSYMNMGAFTIEGDSAEKPFKVDKVILRAPKRLTRLIIDVPPLPGFPEENENIENLFDVCIPYAHGRIIKIIEDTTQMKIRRVHPSGNIWNIKISPMDKIDQEFINKTPREIMTLYQDSFDLRPKIITDTKTGVITFFHPEEPKSLVEWIRDIFKHLINYIF